MARKTGATFAALAVTVLLAGCQPSAAPTPPSASPTIPTSTPTPTFMCTPEAGGPESQCTQAQYDAMKAKDALYTEAEAVYREYWAEVVRLMRAGGAREPTEVLLQTTTGFHLDDVMTSLRDLAEEGSKPQGADPRIEWIQRLPGQSKAGSVVALSTCVDASGWTFYVDGDPVTTGGPAIDDLYFARIGETLKIIGADGKDTSSCDS